jgi:hypothetical protein
LEENGAAAIVKMRKDTPADYVRMLASLLPKMVNLKTNALEGLSDDELEQGIAVLQSIIADRELQGAQSTSFGVSA